MKCCLCGEIMGKVGENYYCFPTDLDHQYHYQDTIKSHTIENFKLFGNLKFIFNESKFSIINTSYSTKPHSFTESIIYGDFNENLIYWRTLEDLKLKIDKIITFL